MNVEKQSEQRKRPSRRISEGIVAVVLYLFIYAALIVFLTGCVRRVIQYSSAPVHLRWELYPVPHEAPERVAHGGSYFETSEWWTRRRSRNLLGELRFMLPEMILLKGLWDFNRSLWLRSFPFHFGLYLLALAAVIAVPAAFLNGHLSPGLTVCLILFARIAAWVGLASVALGATALFIRRITDPDLRNYTYPADLANVCAFALSTALLAVSRLAEGTPAPSQFIIALFSFDRSVAYPPLFTTSMVIGSVVFAYIPWSHMGHFIAKYFTYHAVRWDDAPMHNNPQLAERMAEYLSYRPTWSAAHVGADGRRTWAEIATSAPPGLHGKAVPK